MKNKSIKLLPLGLLIVIISFSSASAQTIYPIKLNHHATPLNQYASVYLSASYGHHRGYHHRYNYGPYYYPYHYGRYSHYRYHRPYYRTHYYRPYYHRHYSNYVWKWAQAGRVPHGALRNRYYRGRPLYRCRAYYSGRTYYGYVHSRGCRIVYHGKPKLINRYLVKVRR